VGFYAFVLPWMTIPFQRYFIRHDWNGTLPGLGTTLARKVTMGGHILFGCGTLLLGPTQFIGPLRRKAPRFHRYCGRLYVIFAVASSILGNMFIAFKGFNLVGGLNMTLAFAAAGTCFGFCAYMCYAKARNGEWTAHRAWTVRSYSQCIAPILYRYWYGVVAALNLYDVPLPNQSKLCYKDTDICPVYLRLFDMIHCWTYWITALMVAELIVRALPPLNREDRKSKCVQDNVISKPEKTIQEDSTSLLAGKQKDISKGGTFPKEVATSTDDAPPQEKVSMLSLNTIGVVLAVIFITMTPKIFSLPPPPPPSS